MVNILLFLHQERRELKYSNPRLEDQAQLIQNKTFFCKKFCQPAKTNLLYYVRFYLKMGKSKLKKRQ